ncbi:MAG: preprotein translocase subunit SecA [Pseudomonadota bacterium]
MVSTIFQRFFGNANDRYLKKAYPLVNKINALEPEVQKLSDEELKDRTPWLRKRLQDGESLDDILVDAFATVREASVRTLKMRHFDVQLIGGIVLHRGMITEMKTGEGKTLVATLAVYLNALSGKGVHVVTVNDYLAKRDSQWMGEIYRFLGLSVDCILNELDDDQRQKAYAADITYGTNNEFGFDYLRDNMKFSAEDMVQRAFNYAIVDEVDCILIDEARTPLIISGPAEDSSGLYIAINKLIPQLKASDYEKDEKARSVTYTEGGMQKIEELLKETGLMKGDSLYDIQNVMLVHHANQALKAHTIFQRDVDYIVKDNKVMIIDEFTGRMMEGRRYSDGLHQALEAKEGVEIERENQTLASITFQNYFRLYPKLSGMTGTAKTEAAEFADIYGLDVIEVPTHRPMVRKDHDDEVYRTAAEKYGAIIKLIEECRKRQQPVLVGTVSIEKSEVISELLKKHKIPHNVLNARYHEQEAYIIAQAGAPGAITIATNMAGRGTDIKLGGNLEMQLEQEIKDVKDENKRKEIEEKLATEITAHESEVLKAGGLFVIATERHESRRIDNQLRGRSGRQGDNGASKFFLSLEDDLMRIFGSERLDNMLKKLGLEEGEAITHPWVTKALERAQQKIEARNYDIRKHLLKYDNVMNDQRKVIYELRRDLMTAEDAKDIVDDMRQDVIDDLVARFIPAGSYPEQWETHSLHEECMRLFGLKLPVVEWTQEEGIADEEIKQRITTAVTDLANEKEKKYGPELLRMAEKSLLLRILDHVWKDHLHSLDHLRQGINLRAYAQRDPLNEYKSEAFNMFEAMLGNLRETVTSALGHLDMDVSVDEDRMRQMTDVEQPTEDMQFVHPEMGGFEPQLGLGEYLAPEAVPSSAVSYVKPEDRDPKDPSTWGELRRNELCPCGSEKRYKHCHGR